MGIDPRLTITQNPRRTIDLGPYDLEKLVADRQSELVARLTWDATVAGDRDALRRISDAQLLGPHHLTAGQSRSRLAMQSAFAYADGAAVATLADLAAWMEQVEDGFALTEIATLDFGGRRPGSMDKGLGDARMRIAELRAEIDAAADGDFWRTSNVIATLSFGGEVHLAGALARALFTPGDVGWGLVKLAAEAKNLHGQSAYALEIVDEVLKSSCSGPALAVRASALRKMAFGHPDRDALHAAAAHVATTLLAIEASSVSGNVARAAFRNIGRTDLSEMADELSNHASRPELLPKDFAGTNDQFCRVLASRIVGLTGRRDLEELHLSRTLTPDQWSASVRAAADTLVLA